MSGEQSRDEFEQFLINHRFDKCLHFIKNNEKDESNSLRILMIDIVRLYTKQQYSKMFGLCGIESDSISKQYRKLASMVHPDKCGILGAQYVFQCLQDAFQTVQKRDDSSSGFSTKCDGCCNFSFTDDVGYESKTSDQKQYEEEDQDKVWLESLPVEDLRKEIRKRQRSIFSPGEDDRDDIQTRNKKLRVARTLLSQKCKNPQNGRGTGGFFVC
eukprot:TRINITY_DN12440_c0_g2_i1.p1 TRINITY_DN12440_c0_g2~~TRINITY_DN12440_c0_g2_i1.p1  ORF type:complete len:214 (-),score=16.76 TRINITY_DN12440_c0_g2_i1:713-1354(-)